MSDQIIGMPDWLASPPGQYLLAWEREQMALAVANIFGFHALQLGMPELEALKANRMPHRWLATQTPCQQAALCTDFSALPFPANSLDLVVLPHALELSADPHAALREVERVLVPEGRVVICGLNPLSLWGFSQWRSHQYQRFGVGQKFLPDAGKFIGLLRLRSWLRLLGFEVESWNSGCYRPALSSEAWLRNFSWMDRLGAYAWPVFGSVYFLVAVKRVRGMTLLKPGWKRARWLANAPVSVVGNTGSVSSAGNNNQQNIKGKNFGSN